VSAITTEFLADCCTRLAARGKTALLLVWDNASWHISKAVKSWIREHNRQVKQDGRGVRIITCPLPVKAPWLNPIEPKWVHGKRAVVEPARLPSISRRSSSTDLLMLKTTTVDGGRLLERGSR
jgi:DDE superfamily endonuclease